MGYIVTIARGPVDVDDKNAWDALNASFAKAPKGEVPQVYHRLIDQLTAKYPCICDLSDDEVDDGVWTDGPLRDNAGPLVTTLGIVSSRIDEVLPFLVEVSNRLGLIVFDPQEGRIHRPTSDSAKTTERAWWKFWK